MNNNIIAGSFGLHHPTVQKVLEIAEELMNQNQFLNIERLYSVAKRTLKIPRKGL